VSAARRLLYHGAVLHYFLKRLLIAVPTLFVIVSLSFFLIHQAKGGPFDEEQALPAEIRANLEAAYGLDQPLLVQYGRYLKGLVHGDFGPSFKYKDFTVTQLIAAGLPVSAALGLLAIALAFSVGVPLGIFAALRHGSGADFVTMAMTVFGFAIPSFVLLPFLTLVFGIYWQWLPVGGWEAGSWRHLVLPVFALALPPTAYIARLMRGSMLEVLQMPFVRTARAKGLQPHTVICRHALRPALLPVVSYLGPAIAGIMTGSLVVETISGLPGIGRYMVQGALNRDYTLVLGMVVVYSSLTIFMGLIVDLLYAWLDPRVRFGE
jgi:oligopeptide transport system permease protein